MSYAFHTSKADLVDIATSEEAVLDNLVIERDGRPDAIKYQLISVYLLEMIKELNTQNQQLQDRIATMEAAVHKINETEAIKKEDESFDSSFSY